MLFSVIIPTYNRAGIVLSTIKTVLEQTYSDFEIIMVDDGSTDNTRETVTALTDPRIRYFYKKNEERSIARNFGANHAKGEYLIFLDSDDSFKPDHLRQLHKFINAQKVRPGFLVSAYDVNNASGQTVSTFDRYGPFTKKDLVFGNPLACSPVTIKSELFRKFQFNTEPRLIIFEDWELWLRIISEHQLVCLPHSSVIIADHDQRSVLTTSPDALAEKINFFSTHAVQNIPMLKEKNNSKLFLGGLYSYGALHIAMHKTAGKKAWGFLVKSIVAQPSLLFKRRFPAILKHLLMP